jgi:hypothetical protein
MTNNLMSFNERMIVISPSVVGNIGLEEAILIQALSDGAQQHDDDWLSMNKDSIRKWLSFWDDTSIKRILKSLVDKGLIHLNSPPFGQSEILFYSFAIKAPTSSKLSINEKRYAETKRQHKSTIPNNWYPDPETRKYITTSLNMPQQLIDSQVGDFINHHIGKGTLAASWSSMFIRWINRYKHLTENNTESTIFNTNQDHKKNITNDWKPDLMAMQILSKNKVDLSFAEECIPEFILFWTEKGEALQTWNTKYITWVRRQWDHYNHKISNMSGPSLMHDEWAPSDDVFKILEMAEINKQFSVTLIPEFILYWKDSGQIMTSWNSKFLQHVKHIWAKRLTKNETSMSQREYITRTTISDRINDTSWAD